MIYILCQRPSDSARELVKAFDGVRIKKFDGAYMWAKGKRLIPEKGDVVICWGDDFPAELDGVRVLNGADIGNKQDAAQKLIEGDVYTINFTRTSPEMRHRANYVGRRNYHSGGHDLLNPPANPDFWAVKYTFEEEYRVHSFGGKSIRAGIKRLREGYTLSPDEAASSGLKLASPWIRSYDAGWRIVYDGFQATAEMRKLAKKAISALGLTFGAVDIGRTDAGDLMVIEVNRAPGLEGGSITAYVNNIKKWLEQELPQAAAPVPTERVPDPVPPPNPPPALYVEEARQEPGDWASFNNWVINPPAPAPARDPYRLHNLREVGARPGGAGTDLRERLRRIETRLNAEFLNFGPTPFVENP